MTIGSGGHVAVLGRVRAAGLLDDDDIDLGVATFVITDLPDDVRLTGDEITIVHNVGVPEGAGVAATPLAPSSSTGLLIQFALDATAQDRSAALAAAGARVVETVHAGNAESGELVLLELDSQATAALVDALGTLPGVDSVEMNHALGLQAIANDSLFISGSMWGMYGDLSAPANGFGSQAAEAWAAGNTGKSTTVVGDVDSGLDYTHPDLYLNVWLNQGELPKTLALVDVDQDGLITFRDLNQSANAAFVADGNANGRIDAGDLLADSRWSDRIDQDTNGFLDDLIGWDFVNNDNNPYDDNGHGTHTAGTIGAIGGNGTGVAGVNWSVQIMPLKFLDASGSGSLANAIKALDYYTAASALDQARQWTSEFIGTNNSWGGGGVSNALQAAIVRGARQDALFIAAAGNGGTDQRGDNNDTIANYPSNYSTVSGAGYEAVVAVAALTSTGALASFSNYGPQTVDLGAPGAGIFSTVPGGYASLSGTSMATPHVAGALALLASLHPDYSASQLRDALLGSTLATASLAGKTVTGGRLDVGALVDGPLQPQSLADLAIGNLSFDGAASVVNFQLSNNGAVDASNVASSVYLSADAAVTTVDLLLGTVTTATVAVGATLARSLSVTVPVQSIAGTYFLGAIADPSNAILEANETNNVSGLSPVILGTVAGETLTGTQVSDTLIAFDGDDTIDGGGGVDVMIGGAGNDSYAVDQQTDAVVEAFNEGTDTVLSSAASYTLPVNVENLTLAAAAIAGRGNASANALVGNDLANTLEGLGGDDNLNGGSGNDALDGGDGIDTADYSAASAALNIHLDTNIVDATAAGLGFDALANIENATGGTGNDQLWGSDITANVFNGGDGNDWMHGFGGNDVLNGGPGSDQLLSGAGADTLNGGDGDDYFWIDELDTINGGPGTDYAYSVTGVGVNVNLATSSLDGVWGSNGNDTLNASGTTIQMFLIGYGGNDTITGGSGSDYIWVDFGPGDVVNGGAGHNELYHIGTGAVSIDLAALDVQTVLGGAQADTLDGSGLSVSANIHGLGGNDIITGGSADDYLYGYDGDDTFRGNAGNDWIDGGAGTLDTALYAGVQANYVITNLGGGAWSVAGTGFTDTLVGVERLQFDGGGTFVL